jgi:ectoine hydroxylase-related dioxygenase (phytanoyl-CoA dioxygenase family)
MSLTGSQVDLYNQHGFVLVKDALDPSDTQPVIDEVAGFIDQRAKKLQAEGKIENLHSEVPFHQRLGLLLAQSTEMVHGLDLMYMRQPAMFAFLGNQNLLDLIEPLVGSEITCNPIQHIRAKPPSSDGSSSSSGAVPWHQDAAVMMKEAENTNLVTCWIPLSQSSVENGCLEVIPNKQDVSYLRHQKEGGTMVVPELMPDEVPIYLECDRGDVILIDPFVIHRSSPNQSDRCRWSLDLRYQTTGHHTGRTAHPDFVVRSRVDPDSVLTDYQHWSHLWQDAFDNPSGYVGHRTD